MEYIKVAALSVAPISELRGSIPLGYALGLPLIKVTVIAVLCNIAVYPILLWGLRHIRHSLIDKVVKRIRNRAGRIHKTRYFGLFALVAIPLPITGVWTATGVSWVLNLNWRKAFQAVAAGTVVAGTIMYFMVAGVISLWN